MIQVQYGIETLIDNEVCVTPYSGVFTGKTKSEAIDKAMKWYDEKGKKLSEYFDHTLILTKPIKDIILKDFDCLFLNELEKIKNNEEKEYTFYVNGKKDYTVKGYDRMMYYKLLMDNFNETIYEIK